MSMGLGPSTPSAVMTVQTKVVCAGPALLCNIMLHPAAAAASITVYDNPTAGSGNILAILQAVSGGASVVFPFDDSPPQALTGITCVVTGTGAQAQVYFQPTSL